MAARAVEAIEHNLLSMEGIVLLVKAAARYAARAMEELVFSHPFNELGAMQLEREVRELLRRFSLTLDEAQTSIFSRGAVSASPSAASLSLRPEFSRLSQMALVLSLER